MENSADPKLKMAEIVALCAKFCALLENAREMEKDDFVAEITTLLPQIYWNFADLAPEETWVEEVYFPEYVDEDLYESIRMRLSTLLGEDDTYLETFEDDMKYSDTPIAASIGEGLADIFQPVYNFVENVRVTGGEMLEEAYVDCRANFTSYWSQTLCNVMRPLNHLRFKQ